MRPMKPRPVGSAADVMVQMTKEIGKREGRPEDGIEIAADAENISHWTLRKQMDPDQVEMPFGRIVRLAGRFKLQSLAHYFAALAEGTFTPGAATTSPPRWDCLTSQAFEDMGKLTAEFFRDLQDGKIDKAEARRILPQIEEMQRHFATMNAHLRAILEAGE